MKKYSPLILAVILVLAYFGVEIRRYTPPPGGEPERGVAHASVSFIEEAFRQRQSNVQVQGQGVVVKVLADDLKGSRHQKFILRLSNDQTVLIAHNIDLAPRIENIKRGDTVSFFGEYEWNSKGGVVHWTHHDPQRRHVGGWLKHQGRTYQ